MKKLLILCLVVGAAVLAAIPAEADCRRVVVAQQHQAVAVVQQHQAVAVVHHDVVATTFLQVPEPVYPVYGLGYGQGADVQGLRDEVAQLRRMLAGHQQAMPPCPPGPMPPAPVVNPPVVGPQPPMPPATGGLSPAKYQSPKLLAMVSRACASCHGPAKQLAGLNLLTDDKLSVADQPEGERWKLYGLMSSGAMPKGGAPVADDELQEAYHYATGK